MSSQDPEIWRLVPWVLAGVSTVVAALSGAVAMLFKINESKNTAAITALEKRLDEESTALKGEIEKANIRAVESDRKHDDCMQDREELRVEMATIKGQLEILQRNTPE